MASNDGGPSDGTGSWNGTSRDSPRANRVEPMTAIGTAGRSSSPVLISEWVWPSESVRTES